MARYYIHRQTYEQRHVMPVGMNSLLGWSDSLRKAKEVYRLARTGLTAWSKRDDRYGVGLYDSDTNTLVAFRAHSIPRADLPSVEVIPPMEKLS